MDISYWEEDGSIVWSHGSPSRLLQEQVLKALIDRLDLARDLANNLTLHLANAFKIYIYILLFVQRPKGLLPTYEGILLIKEHTKREENWYYSVCFRSET